MHRQPSEPQLLVALLSIEYNSYTILTQELHSGHQYSSRLATTMFAKKNALVQLPLTATSALAESNTSKSLIRSFQSASALRITIGYCSATRGIARGDDPETTVSQSQLSKHILHPLEKGISNEKYRTHRNLA
jgi:hypothetical protein